MRILRPTLVVTVGLWLLVGLVYPLVTTAVSGVLFPNRAAASPIVVNGRVVAAANVGQYFDQATYFWGRPSATASNRSGAAQPYNADNSAPSNLGPTNRVLLAEVKARIRALVAANPGLKVSQIPPDLVEASGSGLDPDISPAAAAIQIARVAKATGLSSAALRGFVAKATTGPTLGLFGARVVHVVQLNLEVYSALHAGARAG